MPKKPRPGNKLPKDQRKGRVAGRIEGYRSDAFEHEMNIEQLQARLDLLPEKEENAERRAALQSSIDAEEEAIVILDSAIKVAEAKLEDLS